MFDLLIKNGLVVSPSSTLEADVAVQGREIIGVFKPGQLDVPAARVIEARGKYVLPGGIDPHTHMQDSGMGPSTQSFYQGSVAAAFGGTTTFIDFAIQKPGQSTSEVVKNRRSLADPSVVVDYSLHGGITTACDEIKHLIEYGIPSFKAFMVYRKQGWMSDDDALFRMLQQAREYGGLVGLHAENIAMVEGITERLLREGKTDTRYFEAGRPSIVEGEAVNRAVYLARLAGSAVYIFHVSSKEAVEVIEEARGRGQAAYAETCSHYLAFTDECYARPDARNWTVIPPIRSMEHQQALWSGLARGSLQVLGSDDAGVSSQGKLMGDTFATIPVGLPGVEMRLPALYSEGVAKGVISINRMVAMLSENPARLFGLYPRKGVIAPGSDADLVILDPQCKKTVQATDLHHGTDYSVFEGMKVQGWPVATISKGKVIVENGQMFGKAGDGEFVRRSISPKILSSVSL
ncbi:MAG: dihydropyrimidinase [Chloroflexi bacterium]|nr:dihydropyrimidinase [Chloroflexota bacterium]